MIRVRALLAFLLGLSACGFRLVHFTVQSNHLHLHHRSLRSCVPPGSRSTRACTPRPRTNHAGVSLAFQGRIERNGGEDLTSCSGCGSGCCDERERESLRLAPLISARRSDTRSVDLQGTRSCRHAPQCHPCARFGPFGIRHLVQPAELRLAVFTGLPPSDVPEPRAPRPAGAAIFRFEGTGHPPVLRWPEDFR